MQNRKNGKKSNKKNMTYGKKREDVFIEDFFGDDDEGFDEEDEDRVTEDTLEFLCLDDEMIHPLSAALPNILVCRQVSTISGNNVRI